MEDQVQFCQLFEEGIKYNRRRNISIQPIRGTLFSTSMGSNYMGKISDNSRNSRSSMAVEVRYQYWSETRAHFPPVGEVICYSYIWCLHHCHNDFTKFNTLNCGSRGGLSCLSVLDSWSVIENYGLKFPIISFERHDFYCKTSYDGNSHRKGKVHIWREAD